MFGKKTVASIIAPLKKIVEELLEVQERELKKADDKIVEIRRMEDEVDAHQEEALAVEKQAKKIEDLLS